LAVHLEGSAEGGVDAAGALFGADQLHAQPRRRAGRQGAGKRNWFSP